MRDSVGSVQRVATSRLQLALRPHDLLTYFLSIRSLVYATGEDSAINNEHRARRVTGRVRGEVDSRASQLLDLPKALHGCAHQPFIASRGTVEQLFVQSGANDAGCDGIHANAVRGPFDGERFRQRSDRRFARRVRGNLE